MNKKNWIWFLIIGSAVVLLLVSWFVAPLLFPTLSYSMMYGHMIGGWMMPFGMLGMGAFWIFVIYMLFRSFDDHKGHHADATEQHLKDRLAKGEISIEEYEKLLKTIREDR